MKWLCCVKMSIYKRSCIAVAVLAFALGNIYSQGVLEGLYGMSLCSLPAAANATQVEMPYVIAIDPGHGGMDTGAQGIVEEYTVIDTTAGFLYDLLASDDMFSPIMTRTDTDPDSTHRADVANSANAHLVISIHANSDSHHSSKGFECFPTPPGRPHHSSSLRFAQLTVEQMEQSGHTIRGGEQKSGIKYAYYYGNEKKIVDSDDSKIRSRKSFGILEKVNCPRILVEQCFVTNYEDVNNWATEQGCKNAAQAYYRAIKAYFIENKKN